MMRSLMTAVSGLENHQTRMDVIGNNIANVNTTGFKASRVNFADTLSQTLMGATMPNGNVGGTNPQQVGLGMQIASIDTEFTHGSVSSTGKNTDLAIDTDRGLFVVKNGDQTYYTRNGDFSLDADGNLVMNGSGLHVQGWIGKNGTVSTNGAPQNLHVDMGATMPPQATTEASFINNLSSKDAPATISTMQITLTDGNTPPTLTTVPAEQGQIYKIGSQLGGKTIQGIQITLDNGTVVSGVYGHPGGYELGQQTFPSHTSMITIYDSLGNKHTIPVTFERISNGNLDLGPADNNLTTASKTTDPAVVKAQQAAAAAVKAQQDAQTAQAAAAKDPSNPQLAATAKAATTAATAATAAAAAAKAAAAVKNSTPPPDESAVVTDAKNAAQAAATAATAAQSAAACPPGGPIEAYQAAAKTANAAYQSALTAMRSIQTMAQKYPDNKDIQAALSQAQSSVQQAMTSATAAAAAAGVSAPTPNTNRWLVSVPPGLYDGAYIPKGSDEEIQFDGTTGKIINPPILTANIQAPYPNGANQATQVSFNFNGLTQYESPTNANVGSENGYAPGNYKDMSIGQDGVITASYDNGQRQAIGQLAIATFNNAAGLTKAGGSLYEASNNSGIPKVGTFAAQGVSVTPGALEMSNVDVARQFSDMIVTQRGFQANSKIITVSDEMLETLMNMKRS